VPHMPYQVVADGHTQREAECNAWDALRSMGCHWGDRVTLNMIGCKDIAAYDAPTIHY